MKLSTLHCSFDDLSLFDTNTERRDGDACSKHHTTDYEKEQLMAAFELKHALRLI